MLQKLLVALLSAGLALVAAEVGVHVWLEHFADARQFARFASTNQLIARHLEDSTAGLSIVSHRYLGFRPAPNYAKGENRHNALGYRGAEIAVPKPADEFRIVCMGGSTTYTSISDDWRIAYPALLETTLRERGRTDVSVVNAGADGWTSLESLIDLELCQLDLEPDLVIAYHGINDLFNRLVWPPAAHKGDYSGVTGPLVGRPDVPPLHEHSDLVRTILVSRGWTLPHSAFARTTYRPEPTFFGFEFWEQYRTGRYPSGPFTVASVADMLAANSPVYFERNLEATVDVAKRHGAETVLATFAWCTAFPEQVSSQEDYARGLAEMNDVQRAVAARTGAHLFEFAADFPDDVSLFGDYVHMTEAGTRLMAERFADYLHANGLLERDADDD